MSLSTNPVKGARDFYPEDMRLQNYIFDTWRKTCELYGYEEYDAPILEPTELYLNKGNQEIIDEQTYSFEDRGGRNLTIRTEMTPTVSRMVAGRRQELGYPLRLFSMPQCWRYERTQRGRGREFYQLNADIFGADGIRADLEAIQLSVSILKAFGAKKDMFVVKINSRKLMDYLLNEVVGMDETAAASTRLLIDKRSKIDPAEFEAKLDSLCTESQRESGKAQILVDFLGADSLKSLPDEVKDQPSVADIESILEAMTDSGANCVFDPSLMRGFDYYTDIAFEVFDTDPENNRSLFGGGRYDGLVGMFGSESMTAVGFGMGDITLKNFLESHDLLPMLAPATELYVLGLADGAAKVVKELREMQVNVAFDGTGRKLDKQIKAAEKLGIRYVLFVGDKELANEQYALKDLRSGEQESHGLQRIVSIVKDYRDSD